MKIQKVGKENLFHLSYFSPFLEGTRSKKYISVANATSEFIVVEIDKVTLVRAVNKREMTFGIGVSPLAGEAHIQVIVIFHVKNLNK